MSSSHDDPSVDDDTLAFMDAILAAINAKCPAAAKDLYEYIVDLDRETARVALGLIQTIVSDLSYDHTKLFVSSVEEYRDCGDLMIGTMFAVACQEESLLGIDTDAIKEVRDHLLIRPGDARSPERQAACKVFLARIAELCIFGHDQARLRQNKPSRGHLRLV